LYTLKILEEADKEFQEAVQWYENQAAGLGIKFIDVIRNKLEFIKKHPEKNPKRKGQFREAVVRVFPFTIIYTLYKKEGLITVNSIFHSSRNPNKKYKRRKN
jgi:toxin ParE1/3/4